jgi:hypothetical protein
MHDAQLPLKDAAKPSYVTSNCILPEVRFAVNLIGDQPSNSECGVLADNHIRQETSPLGPCLTLRLHWQLVIRHSSGHAISLSCLTAGLSGKVMTLVACVFIWGSSRLSCIPNPTISVFFYNHREGPLPVFKAVPLYRPHYGKWRHMPPISYTCMESTDGVDCKR